LSSPEGGSWTGFSGGLGESRYPGKKRGGRGEKALFQIFS